MYRTPVIVGKISPNRTLKGLINDNDRRRSIHYSAYFTATCQNEKITSHGVFNNLFVTNIRSVDQQ